MKRNSITTAAATASMLTVGACTAPEAMEPQPIGRSLQMTARLDGGDVTRDYERSLPPRGAEPRRPETPPKNIVVPNADTAGLSQSAATLVQNRDLQVTLNFKGAPAADVFREIFEKVLDVGYVLAPEVEGKTMSFVLEGQVSREELFRALDAVCSGYDWAMLIRDGLVFVVPEADAPKRPSPVYAGWGQAREALSSGTYLIPVWNADANQVAEAVKALVSERGTVFGVRNTNVLVLVESPENAERIGQIVQVLDQPFFANRVLRLYSPQHISAEELRAGVTSFATSAGARASGDGATQFAAIELKRSQQVLVATTVREFIPVLDEWVATLDQPLDREQPRTYLYTLQQSSAGAITTALTAAFDHLPEEDRPEIQTISLGGSRSQSTRPAGAVDQGAAPGGVGGVGGVEADETRTSAPRSGSTAGGEETLVIRAKPGIYAEIRDLIRVLDLAPKQVYLQVVVAEVAITGDAEFGIELFKSLELDNDLDLELFSDVNPATLTPTGSAIILGESAFGLVQTAAARNEVRVLSAPYLLAISGKTSRINVGTEVPITTRTISGTTDAVDPNRIDSSIEYRDTGVILEVTPRVNDRGEIEMDVVQEVSNVEQPSAGAAIQSPSFPQRKLETSVIVRSGDTAALGGIRIERDRDDITKIPILGDLPVLGLAFRSKTVRREQSELVVLITPTIVIDPGRLPGMTDKFVAGIVNLDRLDELIDEADDIDPTKLLFR